MAKHPDKKSISKYTYVNWCSRGPGRWKVYLGRHGGKNGNFKDEDDAARWYNIEAAQLGRPLIEGVPVIPDVSLNDVR